MLANFSATSSPQVGSSHSAPETPHPAKRTGSAGRPTIPAEQRFWDRVDQNGPTSPLGTPCWIWRPVNKHWDGRPTAMPGTPEFEVDGRIISAVRFSYEMAGGHTKPGQPVTRRCKTRLCVNPEHLGTAADRPPRPPGRAIRNGAGLIQSNKARQRRAAARTINAADTALHTIRRADLPKHTRDRYIEALTARIEHPDATLDELGQHLNITKDSYAALLRRALTLAIPGPRPRWQDR